MKSDNAASNQHQLSELSETGEIEEATSDPAPFSGFTGPSADSILAKEVVEHTLGGSPVALKDEKLRTALHSLEHIVGRMKADATEPSLRPLGIIGSTPSDEPILPQWDEAWPLLQRAQRKASLRQH